MRIREHTKRTDILECIAQLKSSWTEYVVKLFDKRSKLSNIDTTKYTDDLMRTASNQLSKGKDRSLTNVHVILTYWKNTAQTFNIIIPFLYKFLKYIMRTYPLVDLSYKSLS